MPEDLHILHGDIQLKNVMLSNDEMILIDRETLMCGNPVFEFAGLYMSYMIFNEDEPGNSLEFSGYSAEICSGLFHETLRKYLGKPDEATYRETLDRIRLLGYVRFLYVLSVIGGKPEYYEQRIIHSREHLTELCSSVKALAI